MKTTLRLLAFALILFAIPGSLKLFGQDKPVRYLFQSGNKIQVSGFGGPFVSFSSVKDEFAVLTGGGGAALFNQTFFIGGYGEGLSTEHFVRDLQIYNSSSQTNHYYDKMQVTFGHGGLWLGYIQNHQNLIHWGGSAKIGAGGVGLTYPGLSSDKFDMLMNDVVFVFIPQLEMEMNLLPWMKMNFGASYRFVNGVNKTYSFRQQDGSLIEKEYFGSNDFSSPSFTVSLLFGGFVPKSGKQK